VQLRESAVPSKTVMHADLGEDDYPGFGRYVWRPADGGLFWSPGLIRIYGRAEQPASEAEFMACLHPGDRTRIEGETDAFLTGDADSYSHSFRIVRPDGEVRYVIDRARVDRDSQNRVIEIRGLNLDVTDFPHLAQASMDDESSESEAGAALPWVSPEDDRLEIGRQASGLAMADIDYRAGTFALTPAAAGLYGLGDQATLVSREALHATFHPEDRAALEQKISESLAPGSGGDLAVEHRVVHPDGTIRWLQVRKRIYFEMLDRVRRPDRGVLAAIDITERKRAETQLRESQERLNLAQQVAGIGVWDVDLKAGRTVWTDGLYDLMQVERGAPVSPEAFFEKVHPEDAEGLCRAFESAILENGAFEREFRVILRNGEVRHMVGQGRVTAQDDDRATRILGVNYDITERKRVVADLTASKARYRGLFDRINAGFCMIEVRLNGPDGRIDYRVVEANPAFYHLTGFPKAILGQWLRDAAPDLEEHWYEIYGAVARTGEPARFEDHSQLLGRWFDVLAYRIDGPEDGRVAILFHEISERKRHEAHVKTLMNEVNHRSKNMLSLVNVIAKHTSAQSGDDFLKKFSERLAALAANQDMLIRADWGTVDLAELVRAQLSHFGDVLDRRIHIGGPKLDVSPSAAEKLGMAIHELSTNAAKYGALANDEGNIRIVWRTSELDDRRVLVVDWLEDGGPSVKPPESAGFGSLVSGSLLESGLEGVVTAQYRPSGLAWSLVCPLRAITEPDTETA